MEKIGVVVPVYKVKKEYLDECVKSIREQTYSALEIVLVDDCSPDECGKYCEQYKEIDNRIKVVHHDKNRGLPAARNTGFNELSEDCTWVTFIDSDDWVDKNTFEDVLNSIDGSSAPEMVIFPACRSYLECEYPAIVYNRIWSGVKELEDLAVLALSMTLKKGSKRRTVIDSAWAKFFSVKFLKENGIEFRSLPYREDGMFFQEAVAYATCVQEISCGLYHYRETSGSMVNSFRKNAPAEQKKYLDMLWNFAEKINRGNTFRKAYYSYSIVSMQNVITQYFFHKDNKDKYFTKRKQCKEYFKQFPYSEVFKNVKLSELKKHFLVKAILIKFKFYYAVALMRKYYLKKNNRVCFE